MLFHLTNKCEISKFYVIPIMAIKSLVDKSMLSITIPNLCTLDQLHPDHCALCAFGWL